MALRTTTRIESTAPWDGGSRGPVAPKQVLIVDDDADVRSSLAQLVRLAGNGALPRVRVAKSGEEAKGLVQAHFFDLVISDYHMGPMDGVELLGHVQNAMPGVPCFLISGDPEAAQERLRASAVGHVTFLCKPFDVTFFLALVRSALDRPLTAASEGPRPVRDDAKGYRRRRARGRLRIRLPRGRRPRWRLAR